MVNYHKELVSALSTILPTYYEMALTSGTETPCISYMETNNYAATDSVGATLGYSMIEDDIKTIDDAINEAVLEIRASKEMNSKSK